MKIEWDSDESIVLCNPRMPQDLKTQAQTLTPFFSNLKAHVWIATSGSTAAAKWVALSKQAILTSARAVNAHLQSNSSDVWIHTLPDFHVGGIGINARSYLSGAKTIHLPWNVLEFYKTTVRYHGTLTALVPAQLHEIVVEDLKAPSSMRGVIIGGGALSETLYHKAMELGWNVLPSYGLTECSSQVATAELGSWQNGSFPLLRVLPHIAIQVHPTGHYAIKSDSLLTGYAFPDETSWSFVDPKDNGWFLTEDKGIINNGSYLRVKGRDAHFIKIGGESVDLSYLEMVLEEIRMNTQITADMALIAFPDERLGHVIHLACTDDLTPIIEQFNDRVMPYERIRGTHKLPAIPRTPLGKLQCHELFRNR